MYASLRRFRILDREAMLPHVEAGFLPLIAQMPGFIAYQMIDLGNGVFLSLSLFETAAQAEASLEASTRWAVAHIDGLVEAISAEAGVIVMGVTAGG